MPKHLIVKKAGKKGKGIFTLKNFKENDLILSVDLSKNKKILRKDLKNLTSEEKNHLIYIGKDKFVTDNSLWSLINHSCSPNSHIKNKSMSKFDFIALSNIEKGQEITFDYEKNTIIGQEMKCYCGSKNCRKIINSSFNSKLAFPPIHFGME